MISIRNKIMSKQINVVPGQRRWITLISIIFMLQILLYGSIAILVISLLTYNIEIFVFMVSVIILQHFLRRSPLFIKLIRKYVKPLWYFRSFKRIYEEPIDEQSRCLFSFHPHSILGFCLLFNLNADDSVMSNMTALASRFMLSIPFCGGILRMWGIEPIDPTNTKKLMEKGTTIGMLPGGFEEATLTTKQQLRVYVQKRKGFIKYALRYGYTIYPVLCFNQHKAFWTYTGLTSLRMSLNKIKLPGVIYGGGFLQWCFPFNIDMVTVVGKGLKRHPGKTGEISEEQVNNLHSEYVRQLQRIHEKYEHEGCVNLAIY